MKKLFVLIALLAGTANAGLIDSVATQNWPTKETKKYKLDMYGYDGRAYEFKTDNGMTCIALFPGGSAVGWQMQCIPTK